MMSETTSLTGHSVRSGKRALRLVITDFMFAEVQPAGEPEKLRSDYPVSMPAKLTLSDLTGVALYHRFCLARMLQTIL